MASKPESTFILSVHKYLPDKEILHREKMNNPYSSGTPDVWYSGNLADLWIEYKFVVLPVRPDTLITPDLSEQQADWLKERYRQGRNVGVIVGCSKGGVIYRDMTWLESIPKSEFIKRMISKQELAHWLVSHTVRRADDPKSSIHNGASRNRSK